jgi:mannose-6-phosphate isomerase-like protein (cupin superfamily)
MKIVQGDQVAAEPAVRHRGGELRARVLLEGTPGRADNFQLSLGLTGEDFVSPRHRHNFEQYRAVLEGKFDFGRDGVMTQGMVGYFPAGVHYGPQSSADGTLAAVLQFGGVGGGGYLSRRQVEAGMEALEAFGEFRDGIFRRREGVGGRKNQDAFEAIWEHVNGRPLDYPASEYAGPVMMNPVELDWVPLGESANVAQKRLGAFAPNRTGARLLEVDAGAQLPASGRGVYLVLLGTGTVAGEPLRRLTAFYVDAGDAATVHADDQLLILHYELPRLS